MLKKLSHVTIYTNDQEETMKFYVDKVGLKVHTDTSYGDMRWLTLCTESQPDFELVILKAGNPESQALVGKQSPEAPLFVFISSDCRADVAALKAKGVSFVKEPTDEFWGVEAMFHDPLGNLLDIVQQA